jgi:hypothetical protein
LFVFSYAACVENPNDNSIIESTKHQASNTKQIPSTNGSTGPLRGRLTIGPEPGRRAKFQETKLVIGIWKLSVFGI